MKDSDIKKSWIVRKMSDICDLQNGYAFQSKTYVDRSNTLNIRMSNIRPSGDFDPEHNIRYLPDNFATDYSQYLLSEGDLVIAMTDMAGEPKILGLPTLVKKTNGRKFLLNQRVGKLCDFSEAINIGFLRYFLSSPSSRRYYSSKGAGGLQINLSKSDILSLPIPLPPLNEQRRIVSTIEQLTDRSNKARAALEDVPKLIAQFRQSVLAAAFRGDLTADWREKNPDVEPASELLERIKQTLPKAAQKKIEEELSDPFDIPDRWTWANLSSVCNSISDGDHQPPPKATSGIPFLTISNISSGNIDFNNSYYVPESYYEKIQENRKAKKGDIIYSVVGSYGIPVLIDSEREFCFQRHIAILKPHQYLIGKYLLFALKSRFVLDQATKVATGTTQLTVTLSGLRKIKIPLVSLPEQLIIIEKIEVLFKAINQIEQQYIDAYNDLNQTLDRSILAKAFRGELVPQDPNDEPAGVLLDRIRAEREQASTPKQRGKTTRKNSSKQLSIDGIE